MNGESGNVVSAPLCFPSNGLIRSLDHVAIFKRQLLLQQTRLARRSFQKISPACSEDFEGFDASDYNLFRYCHNHPMDNTDPMGITDQACRGRGAGVVGKKALKEAIYHVCTRGNARQRIFWHDCDRSRLVELLAESARRFEVSIFALY